MIASSVLVFLSMIKYIFGVYSGFGHPIEPTYKIKSKNMIFSNKYYIVIIKDRKRIRRVDMVMVVNPIL